MVKNTLLLAKYVFLLVVTVLAIVGVVLKSKRPEIIRAIFDQSSVVSEVVPEGKIKSTDGRTNILILGMDARSRDNTNVKSILTDTIMVVSVDGNASKPVIISIPRDLWLDETKSKINAVYELTGEDPQMIVDAVEMVIGIPIHYYGIVGFGAFKDVINTVDGIKIYVPESFDDYKYPIEGKENAIPESGRYEHVHFKQGWQTMDAETALKYARSRYATNPDQRGDFARARRQHEVLMATKNKILSTGILLKPSTIRNLYKDYKRNVKTNLTFTDAVLFANQYKNADIGAVKKIVLSNESTDSGKLGSGTLTSPEEKERNERYGGQYVLRPAYGTFDFIHAMVRKALFE